jgi:hypothetical protein
MKAYGRVVVEIHVFLISALFRYEWSATHPGRLTPDERASGTHWIESCVGSGMEDMEKRKISPLPGLELRPLGRPASSQSLYRLSYPGSVQSKEKRTERDINFIKTISIPTLAHSSETCTRTGSQREKTETADIEIP